MANIIIDPKGPLDEFIHAFNLIVSQAEFKDRKIFDSENPEWHLKRIYYDPELDELFFETENKEE